MSTHEKHLPVYDTAKIRLPLLAEAGQLWRYRFLVRNMISRDLKVRYKRSALGFIWVMLNPLLTMVVMTIVFAQVFRFNVDHYSIFLLSGILLWNVFGQGTIAAMASLSGSGQVLRKLYVPPSSFVVSAIGSAMVNFVYALVPFLLLAVLDQLWPTPTWLFLIVPSLLIAVFSMGVGLIISALYVFFHDTFEIYQVLLQAYYFLTPVFYPLQTLPEPLRTFEQYNPMFIYLDMFRNVVRSATLPSLHELGLGIAAAVLVLVIGWVFFTRLEDEFAYHF